MRTISSQTVLKSLHLFAKYRTFLATHVRSGFGFLNLSTRIEASIIALRNVNFITVRFDASNHGDIKDISLFLGYFKPDGGIYVCSKTPG